MMKELLEIEKIRKHQAVILANNMPETKQDIRLIFAKERTSLQEETIEKYWTRLIVTEAKSLVNN